MNEIFVDNDITTFNYNDDCAYAKLEIDFNKDYYQILKNILINLYYQNLLLLVLLKMKYHIHDY